MLAYVFWHYPDAGLDAGRYEAHLAAFHRALAAASPDGFLGSAAYRIDGAPWLPGSDGYEDWYELADWTALGVLNAAAVSASTRGDHDAVAGLADGGAGGVYQSLRSAARGASDAGLWLTKPRGTPYSEFMGALEALPAVFALWQRQMVLGPTAEFFAAGPEAMLEHAIFPGGWKPRLIRRHRVF